MAAWGGGLYEIMSWTGDMSKDLRVNINFIGAEQHYDCDCEVRSKSKAGTRDHLKKGHFTRVFNKYKNIQRVNLDITGPHACVILAAKAMNVGANISVEHRQYLRSIYKKCGLHREGIEQMGKALDDYVNGTAYELIEPDRTDHTIQIAFDRARDEVTGASIAHLFNYTGPSWHEEGVPTLSLEEAVLRDVQRKREPAYFPNAPVMRRCTNCHKYPEQIECGLKGCAGCKKVMYCGKECQKKDWPKHKKWCEVFAAMPAAPTKESLKKSPICIPGFDPLANEARDPRDGTLPGGPIRYTALPPSESGAHGEAFVTRPSVAGGVFSSPGGCATQ